MIKIKYIEHDGTEHVVNAEKNQSMMEVAINNNVPGIDADCGGQCSCATCHVIVDHDWLDKLPPISEMEESMLDINPERSPASRLSCQLQVVAELDGIILKLPEYQG